MKYLKNKYTGQIYEFQDNETPANLEDWSNPTQSEINNQKRDELKLKLIRSRKAYLKETFQEAFEYMEEGIEYPQKEKRYRAKKEIKNIETAKTLKAIEEFNEEFE